MEANIRALIEAAIQAPSGENAQPWRFRFENNALSMYHNSASDESLYNFNNYGTYVCEGAAVENMLVKAEAMGHALRLEILPDPQNTFLVGRVSLDGNTPQRSEELAKAIPTRTTNRRAYKKTPFTKEDVEALESSFAFFEGEGIRHLRITDRKKITALSKVGSSNEQIMLGNEELHGFFFSHLTWSEKEDREKKVGFYIKTLELPPPIQALFKLFKSWKVMKVLKKVGFPKLVGKGNADTYASSAEFGIITVPSLTPKNMILAGRAFERMWLTAESRGIRLQPLTGTIFMNFFTENVREGHFSAEERALLAEQKKTLYAETGVTEGTIVLMYRLGYGPKASARATRFSVEELTI
jgi:nitroreductase